MKRNNCQKSEQQKRKPTKYCVRKVENCALHIKFSLTKAQDRIKKSF